MDFLATSKPRSNLLLSVLEILDDEDTRLAQMLSSRPSIVVVASRSRSVACLLSAVDSLRLFVVMVIGSPFSRILLHAVLATTLVTVYIPMLFTDELLHPCRLAHHTSRIGLFQKAADGHVARSSGKHQGRPTITVLNIDINK